MLRHRRRQHVWHLPVCNTTPNKPQPGQATKHRHKTDCRHLKWQRHLFDTGTHSTQIHQHTDKHTETTKLGRTTMPMPVSHTVPTPPTIASYCSRCFSRRNFRLKRTHKIKCHTIRRLKRQHTSLSTHWGRKTIQKVAGQDVHRILAYGWSVVGSRTFFQQDFPSLFLLLCFL